MARAAKSKPASRRKGRARVPRRSAPARRPGERETEGRSRTAAAGRGRKERRSASRGRGRTEEKDLPTGEEFLH